MPTRHVRTGYERVTLETTTPWTSGPTEALAGWALVLGGPLTALVWLATRAPAVDRESLGSVLTGFGLLRRGRSGIDLRVAGAAFLPLALGAAVAGRLTLAVVAITTLAALVLAARPLRRR